LIPRKNSGPLPGRGKRDALKGLEANEREKRSSVSEKEEKKAWGWGKSQGKENPGVSMRKPKESNRQYGRKYTAEDNELF